MMTNREYYEKLGLCSRIVTKILKFNESNNVVERYYNPKHANEWIKLYSGLVFKYDTEKFCNEWWERTYNQIDYTMKANEYKHGG